MPAPPVEVIILQDPDPLIGIKFASKIHGSGYYVLVEARIPSAEYYVVSLYDKTTDVLIRRAVVGLEDLSQAEVIP